MNRLFLNDIVKGEYGRKVAYTDVEEINESNIVEVVGKCIGTFNYNKTVIKYLWNYYKGDQPALYRRKTIRDDIINKVVENHAWEIVNFKTGQTYGEPIQIVSLNSKDNVDGYVDKFNNYTRAANKAARDIECGKWQSAVGTGFKALQFTNEKADLPFRIVVPNPLNTFMIYSRYTGERMVAVQELEDENGMLYKLCFTATHEYRIQNGTLLGMTNENGEVVKSKLHAFGGIPIVEYPNNPERISDIELVITMLDAINNMQSNRMDSIEQFVQSWVKFINCEIDEETWRTMKQEGALVVKSNGSDSHADVDIMSQELKQSESQVAKDDIWDNVLSILAIPNKQGNASGDTQGAVELRNGWDFSKQRARMKDPFVIQSEYDLDKVILNMIRIRKGSNECPLSIMDFEPHINHSPTDNMQVKAQSFKMLIEAGIHPLVAITTVGLWNDPDKVYISSKPYLDVLYKTIDDVVENPEEEISRAKELLDVQQTQE